MGVRKQTLISLIKRTSQTVWQAGCNFSSLMQGFKSCFLLKYSRGKCSSNEKRSICCYGKGSRNCRASQDSVSGLALLSVRWPSKVVHSSQQSWSKISNCGWRDGWVGKNRLQQKPDILCEKLDLVMGIYKSSTPTVRWEAETWEPGGLSRWQCAIKWKTERDLCLNKVESKNQLSKVVLWPHNERLLVCTQHVHTKYTNVTKNAIKPGQQEGSVGEVWRPEFDSW